MTEPPNHPPDRSESLGSTLRTGVRVGTIVIVLVLAVSLGTTVVSQVVFAPRLDEVNASIAATRDSYARTVAAESALRSYAATNDASHLSAIGEDARTLMPGLLPAEVRRLGTTQELAGSYDRWTRDWAVPAIDQMESDGQIVEESLTAFLRRGTALFDEYRRTHDLTIEDLRSDRDDLLVAERTLQASAAAVSVLLVIVVLVVQHRQRLRLQRRLERPVLDLLDTMGRVRAGDLSVRPALAGGAPELQELSEGLGQMIESLHHSRVKLDEQQRALRNQSARQAMILRMERQIAGSDDPTQVAIAAVRAARAVSAADRVTLWRLDDIGESLRCLADTASPDCGGDERWIAADVGVAGAAIAEGQPLDERRDDGHWWAWPLVVAGRTVGLLELAEGGVAVDASLVDAVSTLAIHTASALEAARLHGETRALARVDGLTGLSNRRTFDADLAQEVAHSRRHDRPLSLVMIDIDRFKSINDTYGHPVGDEVLRRTAATVAEGLRSGDTAYRLGGEEIAVLARDVGATDAGLLAERLRAEMRRMPMDPDVSVIVTASFGVAQLGGDDPEGALMVLAADAALYDAKRSGRDRVVVAGV